MNLATRLSPWPQTVWLLGASLAAVAVATASAWPIYDSPRVALVAGASWLLAVGAVLAGRVLQWRWWITSSVAFAAYLVAAVPLAIPSALTSPARAARGVADAAVGIVTGWKHLATVSLPAGSFEAVLVPFMVTTMLGSFLVAMWGLGSSRVAPWAMAPMVGMSVFGPAFGDPSAVRSVTLFALRIPAAVHVLLALLAVGIALVWVVVRARLDRASALRQARATTQTVQQSSASLLVTLRRQAAAVGLAGAAVAIGIVVAPFVSAMAARGSVRDAAEPLQAVIAQPSPLTTYRAAFAGDAFGAELFTISGADQIDRIRIASLDAYDGTTFHVAADASATQFARQPGSQVTTVTITIGDGYEGLWVPMVTAAGGAPTFLGDRSEQLAESYYASAALDAGVVVTADAAAGVGLLPGDTYEVATAADPSEAGFTSATGGDPLVTADDMPSLAAWVDLQQTGRTGGDLLELVTRLAARGYLSHSAASTTESSAWEAALPGYTFEPARAGHSASRIDMMFSNLYDQQLRAGESATDAQLVAAVGDDEQFATAAALLARYLGFDSRVATGVLVGTAPEGSGIAACTDVCTGANLTAWAEVRTPSGEWLPLQATPQYTEVPTRIRQGENPPQNPTVPQLPEASVIEPPAVQNDNVATSSDQSPETDGTTISVPRFALYIGAGVLAAGLAALPFMVFPFAKASRTRWRRGNPIPEVALVGAWAELMDLYTDYGWDVPMGLTRGETADVLGRDAAQSLSTVVDWAVFAQHPPLRETADAAWELVRDERRALASENSLGRRLRSAVSSASLKSGLSARHAPVLSTHSVERSARV